MCTESGMEQPIVSRQRAQFLQLLLLTGQRNLSGFSDS